MNEGRGRGGEVEKLTAIFHTEVTKKTLETEYGTD